MVDSLYLQQGMEIEVGKMKKILRYAAYQERCKQDLEKKMKRLRIKPTEFEKILDYLNRMGYYDDSRFLKYYIRGKFNIKKWGKIKIKAHLRKRGFSLESIASHLYLIDDVAYKQTLMELIFKKMDGVKDKPFIASSRLVYNYMIAKGFESNLILNGIEKSKKN